MRLRLLASAFACGPVGGLGHLGGGEAVLGWNVVRQLARFFDVTVLAHPAHQADIELNLQPLALTHLEFTYFALPRWLEWLKDRQGGIQPYAYLWQIKAYLVARRLHRSHHFDVFHHVTFANDWMASFVGALLPIPYVRGPGGGAQQTPSRFLGGYAKRDRLWERFRRLAQRALRLDPFFVLGQERARALLVCNRESLMLMPRRWRAKTRSFPVNGISDTDLILGRTLKWGGQGFQVISAGRLLHWKAFDLAVRAFAVCAERCPDASFTIVGDGPEAARIRDLVHANGLDGKVRIEKWSKRQELLRKMASSDVFLYTSLREGGGAVVVEAMAAGLPVVCLDLSGPSLHVADDCGIKVPAKSPDQVVQEMGEALVQLHSDPATRRRMGRAARKRVEHEYHWDRLGERLFGIYQQAFNLSGKFPSIVDSVLVPSRVEPRREPAQTPVHP